MIRFCHSHFQPFTPRKSQLPSMAGVAFAVDGDGVGFATESYAASALYTTLANLSGAFWRIRRVSSWIKPKRQGHSGWTGPRRCRHADTPARTGGCPKLSFGSRLPLVSGRNEEPFSLMHGIARSNY